MIGCPFHFSVAIIYYSAPGNYERDLLSLPSPNYLLRKRSWEDSRIFLVLPEFESDVQNLNNMDRHFRVIPRSRNSFDYLKKKILRSFRHHIKQQFKQIHSNKFYQWRPSVMRTRVADFYSQAYLVPQNVYEANESVFFLLVMQTVNEVSDFGITPNDTIDDAIRNGFRQKANLQNIKIILSNPVIQGLWCNQWKGLVVPYLNSKLFQRLLNCFDHEDIAQFTQTLERFRIPTRKFIPAQYLPTPHQLEQ
jgi:hypothetical protein